MTDETKLWRPILINVESTFSEFVRTFRNGQIIRDHMPDAPVMMPNADYLFPEDNIFVELKTLEEDGADPETYSKRLVAAYERHGYSGSDLFGHLFRGEPTPDAVGQDMLNRLRRPIVEAVKKANKQIRASKRFFDRASACGVVLVANSANYGLSPAGMLSVIGGAAARLDDNHVDAAVYFTPNVYHDIDGSDIAYQVWTPSYRDEQGIDQLVEFVNDLGRKWGDFVEAATGDHFLERTETPDIEEGNQILRGAVPIRPP
jgi:hypothetical protein